MKLPTLDASTRRARLTEKTTQSLVAAPALTEAARLKEGGARAGALAASGATVAELRMAAAALGGRATGVKRIFMTSYATFGAASTVLLGSLRNERINTAVFGSRARVEGKLPNFVAEQLRSLPKAVIAAVALAAAVQVGAASQQKQRAKLRKSFLEAADLLEAQIAPATVAMPVSTGTVR